MNLYTCSNDSENTAHKPDAFNPEWYIQTPAQKINVTTDIVSQEHLLYDNIPCRLPVCFHNISGVYVFLQLLAYPGEQSQLGVQAFDELDRPTATIFRLEEVDVCLQEKVIIKVLMYVYPAHNPHAGTSTLHIQPISVCASPNQGLQFQYLILHTCWGFKKCERDACGITVCRGVRSYA